MVGELDDYYFKIHHSAHFSSIMNSLFSCLVFTFSGKLDIKIVTDNFRVVSVLRFLSKTATSKIDQKIGKTMNFWLSKKAKIWLKSTTTCVL